MQIRRLMLLGFAACCAVALFAQTLPRDLPSTAKRGYLGRPPHMAQVSRHFHFQGKEYLSLLSERPGSAFQEWQSSDALPLSPGKAEEIARLELRKFLPNDWDWMVAEIGLNRVRGSRSWYYAVTFKSEMDLDSQLAESFVVLIDFGGRPGLIHPWSPESLKK